MASLSRPREGRMIAGVCAGLARRFGLSVGLVRLLFVLSVILPGSQVLVYVVLWALIPNDRGYGYA
jgi:phage shock protein PspC (stress-responsive transcriptional regulator)